MLKNDDPKITSLWLNMESLYQMKEPSGRHSLQCVTMRSYLLTGRSSRKPRSFEKLHEIQKMTKFCFAGSIYFPVLAEG
jgi:hypothetical protein